MAAQPGGPALDHLELDAVEPDQAGERANPQTPVGRLHDARDGVPRETRLIGPGIDAVPRRLGGARGRPQEAADETDTEPARESRAHDLPILPSRLRKLKSVSGV
jgi:hypothetical protein